MKQYTYRELSTQWKVCSSATYKHVQELKKLGLATVNREKEPHKIMIHDDEVWKEIDWSDLSDLITEKSVYEIASIKNVTSNAVRYNIIKQGLVVSMGRKRMTQNEIEELRKYAQDNTIDNIAAHINKSTSTCAQLLRRYKILYKYARKSNENNKVATK